MNRVLVFCLSLIVSALAEDPKFCVKTKADCQNSGLNVTCVEAKPGSTCVKDVVNGSAHFTIASADDMVNNYEHLMIVLVENYNNSDDKFTRYYGVAVVKKNTTFNFKELKGKDSCHTGAGKTAGWKIPVGYLLRKKIMPFVENQYKSVADFFGKSCAPSIKIKTNDTEVQKDLCDLCKGDCTEDDDYADYSGAFKCMYEGSNDRVAFVKHTTPQNVAGKSGNPKDFDLLCPDGTKKATSEFASCFIDKRPSSAIVTKKGSTDVQMYRKILRAVPAKDLAMEGVLYKGVASLEVNNDDVKTFLGDYFRDYKALAGDIPSDNPGGSASQLAACFVFQVSGILFFLFMF